MNRRGTSRPNVIPAKKQGLQQVGKYIQEQLETRTITGHSRALIIDLCDTCKREIRMRREKMKLRRFGYRFICFTCRDEKKYTYETLKELKLILPFWHP
jgi:hypothetical protein